MRERIKDSFDGFGRKVGPGRGVPPTRFTVGSPFSGLNFSTF